MSSTRYKPKCLAIARIVLAVLGLGSALAIQSPAFALDADILSRSVQEEEKRLGARIGVAVIDTKDGTRWNHRGDERFPLNSTHKAFTCAAFLNKVDKSQLALNQTVSVAPASLVPYSPVIEKYVAPQTISLDEVCRAAVSYSDNTAGNVITDAIGGPSAFTSFMQSIGDNKTRLDRKEPELNEATPQDARDTTTPNAIAESLRKIIRGDALTVPSKTLLVGWMVQDKVADALLRAAIPKTWTIADKSGAGGHGSRSIVAVIWPDSRAPVIVGVYITQTVASMSESNAAIARMGKALAEALEH